MKFVSKDNLQRFSAQFKEWIKSLKITASDLDSGSATSGQVLTADGSGGASYVTPSGMTNPMTTAGDLIVGGTDGGPERFGKGTTGQILSSGGDDLEWADSLTDSEVDYIVADKYTITATTIDCTASTDNPTAILVEGTATLSYTFDGVINVCPASVSVTNATGVWTKNSATSGTMVLSNPMGNVSFTVEADKTVLVFSSPSSFTLKTANNAKNWDGTLEYSTDESTWDTWDGTEISSGANNSILLRGTGNDVISSGDGKGFTLTGSNIACKGNIMTLLDYNTPPTTMTSDNASCFSHLFYNCTTLTTAPQLPATTLATSCYEHMFRGCTSLTTAPSLPSTTLANYCYYLMFNGCTSLTTASSLPATTLAPFCYCAMFQGCTSLTTALQLPATTLASGCYSTMFYGCSKIKLSTTQTGDYINEYRIPTIGEGTTASSALSSMFSVTGGSFTGTPTINTIYYTSNTIV